jgi:hypothetical protein
VGAGLPPPGKRNRKEKGRRKSKKKSPLKHGTFFVKKITKICQQEILLKSLEL